MIFSEKFPSESYPVMEHFYTLQGEGYHQGTAAYFIRLAGCDVGCVWCDVKESWNENAHPIMKVNDIIQSVKKYPECTTVVLTGGEPLMHNLTPLTQSLHNNGYKIHIETSGAHPVSGHIDWICLSPKKFKPPIENILSIANELKIIVFNASDFLWAEEFAAKVNPNCKLFLQPEWEKSKLVNPLIIDYIQQHPQWRISLQVHKYLNIP